MEIWTNCMPAPRGIVHEARALEESGWDGINVVDSQNLAADSFVALAVAATSTERLKLGTGVSNPVTRTAAVLASATATVHSVSRGRMTLGIGRGDSALAHLGRAPARLKQFERYLRRRSRRWRLPRRRTRAGSGGWPGPQPGTASRLSRSRRRG